MRREIVIGTRGSKLALRQAEMVAKAIEVRHPSLTTRLERIRTKGDHIQEVPLAKVGGKGLFVKEIEEALLEGKIDIAVHSLKDVPDAIPTGLVLGAYLEREIPFDALVSRTGATLCSLPASAKVGTSSVRRAAQLLALRPDIQIVPLRGNVDTRLRKLEDGLDAIVLAAAGLRRLGLEGVITEILAPPGFVPAVGQGVVVVECKEAEKEILEIIAPLDHAETRMQVLAERAFLKTIGGGCQVPLGANAKIVGKSIEIIGFIAKPDGTLVLKGNASGSIEDPEKVGRELACLLLQQGGSQVLKEIG